ncbi:MAG: DUF5666 domain-containing protein [Anaerolineales bacterium]
MKKLTMGMCLAVVLLAVAAFPALAQTSVTGIVQSVDETSGTFTILTAEGETLTVTAPEGTDLSTLTVGATVEVTGEAAEDGTLVATGIVLISDDGVVEETGNPGFYCSNPNFIQPALGSVAEAYDADYATALDLFCDGGMGVGGVMLTLATSQATGVSPEEITAMRKEMGWGQIWKALAEAGDAAEAESGLEDANDDQGVHPVGMGHAGDDHGGGNSAHGNGGGNSGHGNGRGNS